MGRAVALPRAFYIRPTVTVARDLLGCTLVCRYGSAETAGRIVETEAYLGPEDPASHAAMRPKAARPVLDGLGGQAYVFRVYGLHYCVNAVTGHVGEPGCVLIRALEPTAGLAAMARRRRIRSPTVSLANGPGRLTQALGIGLSHNGADLTRGGLIITPSTSPDRFAIGVGPRVGITRAAQAPLRFWILGHPCVSRPAPSTGRNTPVTMTNRGTALKI